MKYFVKYLRKNKYVLANKLTIKANEEVEVDKEIFDYLNGTFGDSGMFTFRKEEEVSKPTPKRKTATKKATKEVAEISDEKAEEASKE